MEPQNRRNFTVKHESPDSDNVADGEQRSIGDEAIDEEDRLGESAGGKTVTMKKIKGRPRKNDAVNGQNPSSSADSQTIPKPPLGHPPGFGKLQVLASLGGYAWETFGGDFTPHLILVAPKEGMFEILQLSGWSYEGDGIKSMTISFSKSDGNQVFGGVVASSIIAATPVQIIMGSFMQRVWEAPMSR
ncbi:AT-hook motif nuclear-localized protein 9-like isoform X2 [Cucumis melo]|uniref:AT-hook motif nuclear-localized protein n=1 Tax=Cucumis melo TaxID=3656 RepID=A0A1S3C8A9_CUCME|nr:AT-hook motif nuclear-localized protein 9-like isoform X2 [Cucumis melo]